MEIKRKKDISLHMLFLRYLAIFCTIIIFIISIIIFSFYYALSKGFILPANFAEQTLNEVENQLQESEPFDQSLIPFTCTYTLFTETGEIKNSNMSKKDLEYVKEYFSENNNTLMEKYKIIKRSDGDSIVIKYDILAHFASPVLHKLFPKPELLAIIISFSCMILTAVVIALRFSRKLKTQLDPIINATDSIKQRKLDFEIIPTQIKELNRVLESINKLKTALSDSLNQQWNMEQNKKIQISAIAHDIKTPLTIIKGNTELLLESEISKEDKGLLQYIKTSSERIENYIQLLITSITIKDTVNLHNQSFYVKDFISKIINQGKAICHVKNITLYTDVNCLPETFVGDELLISRAILNIIDNAVEYSPYESKIEFRINGSDKDLSFIVADRGKGFSAEGLKNATTEFFTEQIERSGNHYGMGLYIAKSVAEKYQGQLEIKNRLKGNGAVVSFTIRNRL